MTPDGNYIRSEAPEGVFLAAVRDLADTVSTRGVPVHAIRERVRYHGVSYDSTHRLLNDLVESGLVKKLSRGFYWPTGRVPEPRRGMIVYDPQHPTQRWRIEGVALDDRIEATRIVPDDHFRHSWSENSWHHAWRRGWLIEATDA